MAPLTTTNWHHEWALQAAVNDLPIRLPAPDVVAGIHLNDSSNWISSSGPSTSNSVSNYCSIKPIEQQQCHYSSPIHPYQHHSFDKQVVSSAQALPGQSSNGPIDESLVDHSNSAFTVPSTAQSHAYHLTSSYSFLSGQNYFTSNCSSQPSIPSLNHNPPAQTTFMPSSSLHLYHSQIYSNPCPTSTLHNNNKQIINGSSSNDLIDNSITKNEYNVWRPY